MWSVLLIVGALLAVGELHNSPNAAALAEQIDRIFAERFSAEQVVPAPRSSDEEFLRRMHLDLVGRIPTAAEVRKFLANSSPTKRHELIDKLLAGPEYVDYQAHIWWTLLIPESETEPQLRYFETGFKAWFAERFRQRAGFDAIVRQLISVPIAGPDHAPEPVLRSLTAPNLMGFYAAKNAEPAKIAASLTRLFLGLRLECAQCHDHPDDQWTQSQFWNQAAFFAGIERRGKGPFAPLTEDRSRKSVTPMDSAVVAHAALLDQTRTTESQVLTRADLAEWMTAQSNPYFAPAIANRVWSQLMGVGIVEPVDDFRDSNPPTNPELLKVLADGFAASGYDIAFLQRSICLSQAYQRTSRQTDASQSIPNRFAKMAIKPLSSEQFLASMLLAIAHNKQENNMPGEPEGRVPRSIKRILSEAAPHGEPQTSVAQTLALINGDVIHDATSLETSSRLQLVLEEFPNSPQDQVASLFLSTVSRMPTAAEQQFLDDYLSRADAEHRPHRLANIFWMLLNSAEFRWNH